MDGEYFLRRDSVFVLRVYFFVKEFGIILLNVFVLWIVLIKINLVILLR